MLKICLQRGNAHFRPAADVLIFWAIGTPQIAKL
jgi:hypothetical protein